ncbi:MULTISPECIES: glycosyltransferase family 2 protein [unclassified Burkholderia]|uniref:glycosyltransferase family 2 protein n=1 Tax=unclassified Burkholderia TaxID=2613784 RepID=UPI000F57A265|nr:MULTISPECIES: glycosyltransferase family 2 protein [unclassified Burkholderia]RQR79282.1 glycosyltransferase family 2 protein [Burkholderia sp. Bp9011]RQR89272.1 glycosyltransferase family 2 protein [Burkholderia sp. Bp9010]RQS72684.1 glycosyltransferase family 2 protein [Burkholderia sp. Bp8977]
MATFVSKLKILDPAWYAQEYADVALSGLSPIEHYRRYGLLLNRKPCQDWVDDEQKSARDSSSGAIDNRNYLLLSAPHRQELEHLGESSWKSLGNDPAFLFDVSELGFIAGPGWYDFSLQIKSESITGLAKFYMDFGAGFSENDAFSIRYKSDLSAGKVVFIRANVVSLRFDPMELGGEFSVEWLGIRKLTDEAALSQMLMRIRQAHPKFLDQDVSKLSEDFSRELKTSHLKPSDVLDIYEESFLVDKSSDDYDDWIERIERPSLPGRAEVVNILAGFESKPIISVVVPVYNTDEKFLRECIESVLCQSYPNWELCLADDASPDSHVRRVLAEYQDKDPRIKVVYRQRNGHISEASNSALEIASGDYVALLDHDDTLAEHALLFVVEALQSNDTAQVVYSDEDKINALGMRFDPHFKCKWNPDLFYSQNYVSHLGVYKRSLLESIGGFRRGVEGSQDYDLLLRCLPHIDCSEIMHIPKILYHWRVLPGSTALAAGEKSYTEVAGIKALRDHFDAIGVEGVQVEPGIIPNSYHVKWPIVEPQPFVSLLIPTRDYRSVTEVAVRSILNKTSYQNYEVIIIDNESVEPETLDFFEKIQQESRRVKVVRYPYPFNYSAINNFGAKYASGQIIGLINNDIEVISSDWLTEMVRHAARKEIGCVGAKLFYSNGSIQHAGVILGIGGVAGHSHKYFPGDHAGYFGRLSLVQNFSAVTAACLLLRREVFDEVGGLNEADLAVAFNDVDFCLRIRERGYRNIWSPYATLFHHESISRGKEDRPEKIERFNGEVGYMKKRWGETLAADPYYSKHLTQDRENFSIGL